MKKNGLRLGGNITELTAIAPIKPGYFPENRLKVEIKQDQILRNRWLSTQKVPGSDPEVTWLEHLVRQGDHPKMTWLEHFEAVLGWAHTVRQPAIRKMVTIHFARWVILDKDRLQGKDRVPEKELLLGIDGPHILFTSNFDGMLGGYLEDFAGIDEVPLNLIFGHCVGWEGARPADKFIQYVKDHQIQAGIFYANYPKATVGDVNRALDWKEKTENFIQIDLPKLKGKPSAAWEKAASAYLNELAKPTQRDVEYPTRVNRLFK